MKIIKIGKASTNDIVINGDPTVSRVHMQMFIDDEANVFVTDLESMNGTFVNGVKIFGSVKLNTYDILKIGNSLVNWKELLLDDVDAQGAYETIVDENKQNLLISSDDIDVYEQSSKTSNRRKKKTKYIWYATAFLVVIGGLNVYFNSDSQLIVDEWTSKNNPELSYTFNNDGTFSKDSAGIIKEGSYKLIAGRDKQLELSFNDESLPVYLDKLEVSNSPNNGWGNRDGRKIDEYFGNTFNFINQSKHAISIVSSTTNTFKNSNESNVNTLVYFLNRDYTRELNSYNEINISDWKLVSTTTNDIINSNFTSKIMLESCIVKTGDKVSLMVISNIESTYSNGKGTPGVTAAGSDENIIITEGHGTANYSNTFSLLHSPRSWNGTIVYGLMKSDYNFSYEFVDGYLEINGELYKKN